MDFEFHSQEELFQRVRPALHAKEIELHRLGYLDINIGDIWKYLVESKWKSAKGLMLSDIVSDILHIDCKKIDNYLRNEKKKNKKKLISEDGEII